MPLRFLTPPQTPANTPAAEARDLNETESKEFQAAMDSTSTLTVSARVFAKRSANPLFRKPMIITAPAPTGSPDPMGSNSAPALEQTPSLIRRNSF